MRKFIAKLLSFSVCVLLSLACAALLVVYAIPPQFEGIAFSVLTRKYDHLLREASPKIILVSGSSGSFGLERGLLEQETGMPVCNMALAAGLGMPFSTNITKGNIREGDLIVLAYEYAHWYSFDGNLQAEVVMAACDARPELLQYVEKSSHLQLLRYFPTYAFKKTNAFLFEPIVGSEVNQSGAYDETGDLIYPRPECTLPEAPDAQIQIVPAIDPAFAAFVNSFCAYAREQGAQVVVSVPPVLDEVVASTPQEIEAFEAALRETLDCPVISSVSDYIFPRALMFDHIYHCNEAGAKERTLLLAKDINRYLSA